MPGIKIIAKEESSPEPQYAKYIGNKNSKIFHINTCSSLPIEKNRVYFDSIEEAIKQGYKACNICNP